MNGGEWGDTFDSPRRIIYDPAPKRVERRMGFGPRMRKAGAGVLLAIDIVIAGFGVKTIADYHESEAENAVACAADYCIPEAVAAEAQASDSLAISFTEETLPVIESPAPALNTIPSPDVTTVASQKTTLPVDVNVFREYRMPVDIETARQIEAVRLTTEGYQNFFANLDLSWFDYTQGHNDFNPNKVAIRQGKTEWVTAHFTAGYFNETGWSVTHPEGAFSPKRMVDSMATRDSGPCCAVNFAIDRNGRVYQLAPFNAKLRHNPPYDEKNTGWELEAHAQSAMKTVQYESAMYLTIAMLVNEGLLGNAPLPDVLRGHGETRDKFREANPRTSLHDKNDFDEPLMHLFRLKVEEFLRSNPQAVQLTQKLR